VRDGELDADKIAVLPERVVDLVSDNAAHRRTVRLHRQPLLPVDPSDGTSSHHPDAARSPTTSPDTFG
jgi:hypothetical protein